MLKRGAGPKYTARRAAKNYQRSLKVKAIRAGLKRRTAATGPGVAEAASHNGAPPPEKLEGSQR